MKESSGKSQSGDRFSPAFRAPPLPDYLGLARRLGFERFVFVQPSAYRISRAPDHADLLPMARAIIETAPEEATRRRILADNPAKLFGF